MNDKNEPQDAGPQDEQMDENDNSIELTSATQHVVSLGGTISGLGSMRATLSITTSLTANHIQAAALFARQAAAMEQEYGSEAVNAGEDVKADHRAYVIGTVFASTAFLEATINELYDLDRLHIPASAIVWEKLLRGKTGVGTLMKYQLLLQLAGKVPLEKGNQPYQDADTLIFLRNMLTHYVPGRHTQTGEDMPELARNLRAKYFAMNPFYLPNSHFLHTHLSHGCAQWAVETAWRFTDAFFARLEIAPPYEHVRERLKTH